MKKIYLLVCSFFLFNCFTAKSQVIYTEDFEGTGGTMPAGITLINNDGLTPSATVAYVTDAWIVREDFIAGNNDSIAVSTSWYDPAGTSDDWLITPPITGLTANAILSWDAMAPDVAYADGYEVWVSTGAATVAGMTAGTMVFSTAGESTTWVRRSAGLSAFAGQTVRVGFRNNSIDKFLLFLDSIVVENVALNPDMAVASASPSDYTIIPLSQATAMTLDADVVNNSFANATDATLTVNVYDALNLTTPIQTTTSPTTAVNSAATATLNAGTFTPSTAANYVFEYIATATGDVNTANDTAYVGVSITNNLYARDDANVVFNAGIGAGPVGYLGSMFTITAATPLDSVFAAFTKPATSIVVGDGVGDSTRIVVFDVAAGLPNVEIGRSDAYVFTPADTSVLITRTLAVNATAGGVLNLTPGTYFVAVEENNTNVGLAFTDNNFRLNTIYFSWVGQAWTPAEAFPAQFQRVPVIRPILGCVISATSSSLDATCGGPDGSATITATGTAPYTYAWNGGQTTATATGLTPGDYTVTVTDATGCELSDTVTVFSSITPTISAATTTDVSCNGGTTGAIDITVSGGTAPYTFNWSNSATTEDLIGLAAGSYTGTITDANGCTTVGGPLAITEPDSLNLSATITDASTAGGTDGAVDLTVTGGTAPYTFNWSNGTTTEDLTGVAAGSYTGTITDANGCTISATVTVLDGPTSVVINVNDLQIVLFPNPTKGQVALSLNLPLETDVNIRVSNVTGQTVREINDNNVLNKTYELDLREYAAGVYMVRISAFDKVITKRLIIK